MRIARILVLLTAALLPGLVESCELVELDNDRNVIGGGGTVWRPNYHTPPCARIKLDVSRFSDGGSELRGRPPANFLEVEFADEMSVMYLQTPLGVAEKTVEVAPGDGRVSEGTAFRVVRGGQLLKVSVGFQSDDTFERYFLSSIQVEDVE